MASRSSGVEKTHSTTESSIDPAQMGVGLKFSEINYLFVVSRRNGSKGLRTLGGRDRAEDKFG